MPQSIPLGDSGGDSATFTAIGDSYAGTITSLDVRNQTDPKTGQPKTFADGNPMLVLVVGLELADGSTVTLWAKRGKGTDQGLPLWSAIDQAARAAEVEALEVGAQLAVRFSAESPNAGLSPTKLYVAQYKPQAPASVPLDLFSQ